MGSQAKKNRAIGEKKNDLNEVHVLDLSRYRHDQSRWDLTKIEHRNEAIQIVHEVKPKFLIGGADTVATKAGRIISKLLEIQAEQGGHYVFRKKGNNHEDPKTANCRKIKKNECTIYSNSECVINALRHQ